MTRSALTGAGGDANSSDANVVVALGCTGILITPRIVLTAAHCIWGHEGNDNCLSQGVANQVVVAHTGNDGTGVGASFAPHPSLPFASRVNHCFGTGDEEKAYDVAVVYLQEPVIAASMLARDPAQLLAVPRVIRPKLQTPPSSGGRYPWTLGFAGFGGLGHFVRQAILVTNGDFDENAVGDSWQWEYDDENGWDSERGDSGGPLFVQGVDGNREVIGVLNGHASDVWKGRYIVWADVTRGANHTWLLDHVREAAIAPELRHSALWLARHGKTTDDWWGELDYSGPCDTAHDGDCDGWWDRNPDGEHPLHDNCPALANAGQDDTNDTGIGDACRVCPLGDQDDPDHDGVCSSCPPWNPDCAPDNCPTVANPDQANCNEDAELASIARGTPVSILGDACDPVPCPRATPVGEPDPAPSCLTGPHLYRVVRDEIAIRPVAPHSPSGQSAALADVPTKARYCQAVQVATPSGNLNVVCNRPDQERDRELWESETASSRLFPDTNRPWQRVSLAEARPGFTWSRESNAGHLVTYADASSRSLYWDYLDDDDFWRSHGNLVGSAKPGDADCTKRIFGRVGTCLDGRLWLHADTAVGNSVDTVNGITVGTHGADLANHYVEIRPDETHHVAPCELPPLDPCIMTPMACVADFLYRFEDGLCPMCTRAHLAAIADDRIQLPLLRKPDDRMYGVLWKDVLDSDDDLAMNETSTLARDVLLTEHVVTAVETAAPHAGEIDAIALAADAGGMSYYFHVGSSTNGDAFDVESMIQPGGGGLMSVATFESSVSAVAPSSSATALGRTDAIVVYSRTMGGAFVLGGQDAWGSPVYAVDYVPLYDGPQSLTGWLYGEVLAATLTRPSTPSEYASGTASPSFLWTVERDPEMGDVRIAVREITRDEIGAPVFAIPIDAGDDAYALSTAWDSPDTVLLTASNRTTGQWGLAELGGFLPCVTGLGGYDDSCFVIRPHLRRGARPGHLFRGIYAEHDALVIPSGALDDASAEWRVRADRARKPELGVAPPIVAGDLRAWWAQ